MTGRKDLMEIFLAAQKAVDALHTCGPMQPAPLLCPMDDWERPDPNQPLPLWDLWGDAGLLTRPHIYARYSKEGL